MLKENQVEKYLRDHLMKKGWRMSNEVKSAGIHGCDIIAFRPKWNKSLLVEAKGGGKKETQMMHNGFYTLLGQIISRMDIEGNHPKRGRTYAIAIPKTWEKTFRNKLKTMAFGWSLLKLKVFLVKGDGEVEEKTYKQFFM